MGVLDTLGNASQATKSVKLCLDAGLLAECDRLLREMEDAAAQDEKHGSLAREMTTAVIEEYERVRERMAASEVTFEFRALDWTKRLALQAEHPPRKGNMVDQVQGYNVETFTPAIIKASCVSVTDAAGDTATKIPVKTWTGLFRKLNLPQIDMLFRAATHANDRVAQVPSSARFLLESQDSEASSMLQDPGKAPLPSGSEAGSRRTSRRSSATKKAASSGS